MPIRFDGPPPKQFPCRIGIDTWTKKAKKGKRPSQVPYKYTDAKSDIEGWHDPSLWLPVPFDLCVVKMDDRTRTGWWTGKVWEGLRIKPEDNIRYWKRYNEE